MSKNLFQVYTANPITSNLSTDLMYFARSPYNAGEDAGMTFANFAAQFGAPFTPASLTEVNDTNVTLALGGTPSSALLQAVTLTLGWTGVLSPDRGGSGVNNGTRTLTLAGNLSTVGAFTTAFTMTGNTAVTFPTAGTLATTSQIPVVNPSALTEVNDTNITITLGGTPATALLQAVTITLGWTGVLSPDRGGSGVNNGSSTFTMGGSHTLSGAFASTFIFTNTTSVTFPTSGTLATTSQLPTPSAMTSANDTNVTISLGGTPATSLLQSVSLTMGWTGQLSLARGGSNASLTASNGGIVYSNASQMAILSGTTTATQMLQSGSSTAPAWSTTTWPATSTINQLLYSSSANNIVGLSTANSGVLVTSGSGVPSISTTLPNSLAMGTPASLTLTNATGLPISGLTGLGTGVATALGLAVSGSSGIALINSPSFITPTLGAASATSLTFSSTSGIIGTTTNNNAAAGSVGEFISSVIAVASAVSVTSNNAVINVTSISLTAGDWEVWGNLGFNIGGSCTAIEGWSSATSATKPDGSLLSFLGAAGFASGSSVSIPYVRYSLSGTTTVFLSASASFSSSTVSSYGGIFARRVR